MTGRICGKVRFEPGAKQLLAAPLISADVIYVPLWKKTPAYLLVLPGSRARIVRCGGRYDPQLVKRSSE